MSFFDIVKTKPIKVTLLPINEIVEISAGSRAEAVMEITPDTIAVLSNNELLSLQEGLDINCTLEAVKKDSEFAQTMLLDTIGLLVHAASHQVVKDLTLRSRYKLDSALFFKFDDVDMSQQQLQKIEESLSALVASNVAIRRVTRSHDRAVQILEANKHLDGAALLKTLSEPKVSMVQVGEYETSWRCPYLSTTGAIAGLYKLELFNGGFLAHFAADFRTVDAEPMRSSAKFQGEMAQILDLYLSQAKTIGLDSAAAINAKILQTKELESAIAYFEFNHEKQIAEIASRVRPGMKAVFVAGPSSSGKTTFANRLSVHLRARGYEPIRLSMDDYYGFPEKAPRIPGTAKPDFEHIQSLDLDRLNKVVNGLIQGDEVTLAHFDFKLGRPGDGPRIRLPSSGLLIIEGIHGLNDIITQIVPPEQRLRVFIQPVGALPWDEIHLIDPILTRLLRRMCRDFCFRNCSAEKTIDSWPSVRSGEEHWILPNQTKADCYFNSSVMYEQFVQRVYAYPLLQQVPQSSPQFAMARQLLRMISPLQPIPIKLVPETSLFYEFLPQGSQYEEFFF